MFKRPAMQAQHLRWRWRVLGHHKRKWKATRTAKLGGDPCQAKQGHKHTDLEFKTSEDINNKSWYNAFTDLHVLSSVDHHRSVANRRTLTQLSSLMASPVRILQLIAKQLKRNWRMTWDPTLKASMPRLGIIPSIQKIYIVICHIISYVVSA